MNGSRRLAAFATALAALILVTWWSYRSGGLVATLVEATTDRGRSLEVLRAYLATWGALAPLAYVLLVVVEVLIAPIPGTLLYAPGGAIFGGLAGGTLSLAGNVIGAGVACAVARTWGEPLGRRLHSPQFTHLRRTIAVRGFWLILLLRANPLTSSDLVSYAAGLVGIHVWKVMAGTLIGMAPLCFAQAYLADRLFRVLPGSAWVVLVFGGAYAAVVLWILLRPGRQEPDTLSTTGSGRPS